MDISYENQKRNTRRHHKRVPEQVGVVENTHEPQTNREQTERVRACEDISLLTHLQQVEAVHDLRGERQRDLINGRRHLRTRV